MTLQSEIRKQYKLMVKSEGRREMVYDVCHDEVVLHTMMYTVMRLSTIRVCKSLHFFKF